jgi:predicted permease
VNAFAFSFNAVSPLLLLMFLGWLLRRLALIGERDVDFLNKLCFKCLLPVHIFNSVLSVDFRAEFNPVLVLVFLSGVTITIILSWIIFSATIKDPERRAVFIVCSYRSNNLIYAMPLAANLFGDEGTRVAAMLIPFTIIYFNLVTVIVMVYHANIIKNNGRFAGTGELGAALGKTAVEVARNPLILGSLAGIILALVRLPLPGVLRTTVTQVAQSSTPVALLLLGAQINLSSLRSGLSSVLGVSLLRLVIVPAALIPVAVAFGFRGPELSAVAIAFAAPPAVMNIVMARNYGLAPAFTAQSVYFSTVLSLFTIFGLISLLRMLGLM